MSSSSLSRLITHYVRDIRRYYPDDPLLAEYLKSDDIQSFDKQYSLVPVDQIGDVFYANAVIQLRALSKKFLDSSQSDPALRSKGAIDKFRLSNIRCRRTNRIIKSISPLGSGPENLLLSEAACLIEEWLSRAQLLSPCMATIAGALRHGPGASLGCSGTSAYEKDALSRPTCTSDGLSRLYLSILAYDPNAQEAELQRAIQFGGIKVVHGSKISTVPKTADIDRTICIEPTVNMLFQLSTGRLLERVLSSIGLATDTQPDVNRLLARFGSIDGSFGTLDLQSASDSLSLELCKRLLPPAWFNWLSFIRSKSTHINQKRTPLAMMSSMGNGFTFPLQTLLFASIVVASYRIYGIPSYTRGGCPRFGVFGDDIIVDRRIFSLVRKNLESIGFVINSDKTFNHGGFRESCGHDWFHGFSLRPVYVQSLRTRQDRYSLLNRLIRWSARTGLSIPSTCGLLQSMVGSEVNFIPPWESDDGGIKVPYGYAKHCSALLRLQNTTLRRVLAVQKGAFVYQKDCVSPDRINFWHWKRKLSTQKEKVLGYPLNEGALMLSILGGYVRGTGVMVRSRTTMYRSGVFGVAPGWDAPIDAPQFSGWRVSYAAWTAAIWTNLKSPS